MSELPVSLHKKEILYAVEHSDVVMISAETGSGKTTQIPQFLIQAGYTIGDKKIGVVLPRKIAAISLAKRVADELGCFNGQIAHKVRFNSGVNSNTRVVFMTDGCLVQELYSSPLLEEYSVVVLDDVHERSISYDILFSFLKRILLKRPEFKLIVTSATLENQNLKEFFTVNREIRGEGRQLKCREVNITGRLHDVFVHYLKEPTRNYFLKIFQTIVYIDREKSHGHVLVFLTSTEQIEGMKHMLESYMGENKRRLKLLPLHSKLPPEQQALIFEPSFDRKIILSTNIAESSITIPDIKYVIDSGYVKVKLFDWEAGIDKMAVVPCGKTSANQRAGRAGRVQDGQCFRIYHQAAHTAMPEKIPPELMRVDLSGFLLKLKGLGIQDILTFEMLERPEDAQISKAIDILYAYELIDQQFELTEKGSRVAEFSIDLRNGCMLMNSFQPRFGCSKEILMLVSMLEVVGQLYSGQGLGVLKAKKKVGAKEGDFLTLINFFLRYHHANTNDRKRIAAEYKLRPPTMDQALRIYDQLVAQVKKFNRFATAGEEMEHRFGESKKAMLEIKSSLDEQEAILRCILSGYFTNIAQVQGDGSYLNIRSKQKLVLHSTSILTVVYPEWVVYHQIVKTSSYYLHNASQIDPEWIFELAGNYYKDKRKDQAQNNYAALQTIDRPDPTPAHHTDQKPLLQVGAPKKKPEVFNTAVLGFKKMKKATLSFQTDI